MIKSFYLTAFALAFLSMNTALAGHSEGNGGDPVGLAFVASAGQAIDRLQSSGLGESTPELIQVLREKLSSAKILVSDEALFVVTNGVSQNSVAVNQPSLSMITLSRRWNDLVDPRLKQALALHEIAGLANLEKTGEYRLSAAFLTFLGFESDSASALSNALSTNETMSPTVGEISNEMGAWLLSWGTELIPRIDLFFPAKTRSFRVCGKHFDTSEDAVPSYRDCDSIVQNSALSICTFRFEVESHNSRSWAVTRPLKMTNIQKKASCSNCTRSSESLTFDLSFGPNTAQSLKAECQIIDSNRSSFAMSFGDLKRILGRYFAIRQSPPQPL